MTVLFEDRGFYYIPITQHVLSYAQCSESVFRMDRTSWRLPVPFGSVTMGESLRLPMTQFPCLLSEEDGLQGFGDFRVDSQKGSLTCFSLPTATTG